jgi:hypothetical protein
MKKPPLLPIEALRRVVRMARFNGTGILVVAGAFALLSASTHDTASTAIGLLVAGAGAMELHGATLVQRGEERGMNWMIGSQFYLMAVIFFYVGQGLHHVDISLFQRYVSLNDEQRQTIAQSGLTIDQFFRGVYVASYVTFGVVTLFYQSGMAFYYRRRRPAVAAALREPDGHP